MFAFKRHWTFSVTQTFIPLHHLFIFIVIDFSINDTALRIKNCPHVILINRLRETSSDNYVILFEVKGSQLWRNYKFHYYVSRPLTHDSNVFQFPGWYAIYLKIKIHIVVLFASNNEGSITNAGCQLSHWYNTFIYNTSMLTTGNSEYLYPGLNSYKTNQCIVGDILPQPDDRAALFLSWGGTTPI